jgi:WXG100 family type VII secretion target
MTISMTPEELEENAAAVQGAAEDFQTQFDSVKSKVTGATWEGAAAAAFQDLFHDATTQFNGMLDQINGIADLLRRAKDGLSQADQEIARGMID